MSRYLLDTNIVLRFSDPRDRQHNLVTDAVFRVTAQGDQCVITSQVLIEFWVVATRPVTVNGFGWSVEQTRASIDRLLNIFPRLEDRPEVFPIWWRSFAHAESE